MALGPGWPTTPICCFSAGAPTATVIDDGYALPFDPAGLAAVTSDRRPPRDPEWQLVKPHHSGRVAADIPLTVGTSIYALVGRDRHARRTGGRLWQHHHRAQPGAAGHRARIRPTSVCVGHPYGTLRSAKYGR
ncbi:MAG: hypothetical protein ACRDUY_09065 [Nitriliruptorales bacterium]